MALISASVLGLEIALMRALSISRWHHFAYLVVALALLGFGASGTWLGIVSARVLPHFASWSRSLTLVLALSIALCYRLAETLPLTMRYLLFSGEQILYLFSYQALIFIPFLVAGFLIGLALLRFAPSVSLVYGANLLGSGLGPAAAAGLLLWLPPERLIQVLALVVWACVFIWPARSRTKGSWLRHGVTAVVGLLLAVDLVVLPPPMQLDPHKMLAELKRWQQQDDARHLATRHGPQARLDVFASPRLHYTLFAGLTATAPPPPQLLLLADGHTAGPIFRIEAPSEAPILEHVPMSVAHRLLPHARVLLLAETSGVNVWLARRFGAAHITAVLENPQILDLFLGPLADCGGAAFRGDDLEVCVSSARHYLESTEHRFDLVQVVSTEAMAAGVSSLLSLHENYLLTVEGTARCLEHLTPRGLMSITRGLQSPPRDNVKILATVVAALEKIGVQRPAEHVAQVRNHLAICTLASRRPFKPERVRQVVRISDRLWLDIDSLPGYDPGAREPFNRLAGPPGVEGTFYRLAAERIFSEQRQRFYEQWAYNVRPATDDRPYFFNFFRWRSLSRFIQCHGHHWFQRLELGYAVLVISLVQVVAAAALLFLLPLVCWSRYDRFPPGGALALGYFLLLGLAFLALEISLMQRFTLLMADPVLAAAGVLSAFLFFSGCGSLCSQYRPRTSRRAVAIAACGIALVAPLVLFLSHWLLGTVASWSTPGRFLVTFLVPAPLAFLMGWPFPAGMRLLQRCSPGLMPWAWGINGFASVAAAPLTVLLAMSLGFRMVLLLAVGCYLLALALILKVCKLKQP